ncbi:MAG: DUF2145 domain-containing protein [Chitinophagaceae bacterium]|nr:DUF2145 domain-containing protein [Rubrivivax sp.]
MSRRARWARASLAQAVLVAVGCAVAGPGHAGALRHCDPPTPISAHQQDRLLRFAAIIKTELDASGRRLALMSRSGLDLARFGQRYSHTGVSLKASGNTPWSVRQLYYACDEGRPKIFDQGISGFLVGSDDPSLGYISVVLLPPASGDPLEQAALDDRLALRLLGTRYSANAHAFSDTYQNCNQWVAELLALAWGPDIAAATDRNPRGQAQRWLKVQGYEPTVFDVGNRALMWLGNLIPWLHADDHPAEDLDRALYRVSMPASIEAFVQAAVPGAERLEFCHHGPRVVLRRGWAPIAAGCEPGAQDQVTWLD